MSEKNLQYYKSLNYNIIVKREELDGDTWFVAYCTEFGVNACHGIGNTESEAIESFKAEKDFFIEYLYREGLDIPEPEDDELSNYSGVFTVRTTRWLHYRLVSQSKEQGVSLNSYINQILSYGLGAETSFNQSIHIMDELKSEISESINDFLERTNSLIYNKNEIAKLSVVSNSSKKEREEIQYAIAS